MAVRDATMNRLKEVVARKEVVRTITITDHNMRKDPTNDCAIYATWEVMLKVIADYLITQMATMRTNHLSSQQKANFR